MHKLRLLFLSSFFIVATATSQEQAEKKFDLYFNTGMAFPHEPNEFSDYWGMGFAFGGGMGFSLSEVVSLSGSIDYCTFPIDEEAFIKDLRSFGIDPSGFSLMGGSVSTVAVMANAKVLLTSAPNIVLPYITAGAGFTNFSTSDITLTYQTQETTAEGNSESAFGLMVGAGIEFPVGAFKLFLEGKYGIGYTEGINTAFIPVWAGIKMKI